MRNWILINFFLSFFFTSGSLSTARTIPALNKRSNLLNGLLVQRTVSMSQKSCSCPDAFSCACCQKVTILRRGLSRMLCVNFGYQETGLSMNITLGSRAIRQASIIDYRAFKVCTFLPDCRYSLACVDVMEVTKYPRSITICVQFDITSKHDNWLINYNCISLSTVLPGQSSSTFPPSTTNIVLNGSTMGMPPTGMPQPGQMPQNTSGMLMPMPMPGSVSTGQMGGMTTQTTGQMPPNGQMMPPNGQMMPPNGQMMPPNGQMMPPPGQMQRMINDYSRLIVSRSIRTVSEAYDGESHDSNISNRKLRFNELSNDDDGFGDELDWQKVSPYDQIRKKRSNTVRRGARDAPMKMQVIYRHRKTRLPKVFGNEDRSSRIVNGNTVSIPMPNLDAGTAFGSELTLSNNAFASPGMEQVPLSVPLTPQANAAVPLPVLVLENVPVKNTPIQSIAPTFFVNYDNRTSSFPDRMPPGFGVYSRIGPPVKNESAPSLDRSIEELETIGPEIKLHANSKIVEASSTGSGSGNIVFPE